MEGLLCLSSGLQPQYKLDILRLLALPKGASIQFRYGEDLIDDAVQESLSLNRGIGTKVLLAYVNCSATARRTDNTCPIVPCRFGILRNSRVAGSRFILELQLDDFAFCTDLEAFHKKLPSRSPSWVEGEDLPQGLWCLETVVSEMDAGVPSPQTTAWERIVTSLHAADDFSQETLFFRFESLSELKATKSLDPAQAEYRLKSGKNYEINIYHFHPKGDESVMSRGDALISVQVSSPLIESVSNPAMPIDSPYDVKTFRLRTALTTTSQYGFIVVRIEDRATGKAIESQPELYVSAEVRPAIFKPLLFTVLLGGFLAGQQLLTISATKPPVSSATIIGTILIGVVTAGIAVFGLKKPM